MLSEFADPPPGEFQEWIQGLRKMGNGSEVPGRYQEGENSELNEFEPQMNSREDPRFYARVAHTLQIVRFIDSFRSRWLFTHRFC